MRAVAVARAREARPGAAAVARPALGARLATPGVLVALIAISAFARTRIITTGYWIDEGISVGISSHPLSKIPQLLREDGSPPLYYVLLHGWIRLFGTSEV